MTSAVLITGAAGFLGRHVARAWSRQGHEVVGLGHGAWAEAEWRAWGLSHWLEGEVDLPGLLAMKVQPEVILHCAGSGSVGFSIAHPAEDFARSVGTLLAVLEFVRLQAPGARVVLPSSAAVYGQAPCLPIPVSAPLAPVSPYGVHKRLAEELCRSYGAHFGVATVLLRFFSLFGSGLRKQLLWEACQRFADGQATFMGSGLELRDWLHVEDAASLTLSAAPQAAPSAPVANGGCGKGLEVQAILGWLREAFPQAPPLAFRGLPRPGDPDAFVADIGEATAWGWRAAVAPEAAVRAYAAWFLEGAP